MVFTSLSIAVSLILQGLQLIQTKIAIPSERAGHSSPILSFLHLERYSGIKLVQSVHASLAALSKVIRGTQLLTSEVQNLAAALLNQEVRHVLPFLKIQLPTFLAKYTGLVKKP